MVAAHRIPGRPERYRRVVPAEPRLVGARAHRRLPHVLRPQLRSTMTTVVAGANGLVGSRIVARLLEAGEGVLASGRGPRRVDAGAADGGGDLSVGPGKLARLLRAGQPDRVSNRGGP